MLLTTFDPFAVPSADRLARWAFSTSVSDGQLARMDAVRRDNEIELRFDLPGVSRDSIDVTVDHGVLTVKAARGEEYAEGEKPFVRERAIGSVARRVRLSDAVDAGKIEAGYHDGVLTVHVPLAEQAKPRKIEVRTDAQAITA